MKIDPNILSTYLSGEFYCLPICVQKHNSKPKIIASCMVVHDNYLNHAGTIIKEGAKYLLNAGHTFFDNSNEKIYIHHPDSHEIIEVPRGSTLIDESLDLLL